MDWPTIVLPSCLKGEKRCRTGSCASLSIVHVVCSLRCCVYFFLFFGVFCFYFVFVNNLHIPFYRMMWYIPFTQVPPLCHSHRECKLLLFRLEISSRWFRGSCSSRRARKRCVRVRVYQGWIDTRRFLSPLLVCLTLWFGWWNYACVCFYK